ncbi:MAG: class I SAM-dependent methyltransferase [Pseudomonadota bacterium]
MDRAVYDRMAENEAEHWWFTGRRAVLGALLDRLDLKPSSTILEAGCGSGGNLQLLSRYGHLDAFEYDDTARAEAEAKGVTAVASGGLPNDLPPGGPWDLIALFDVLEHIEDDCASLVALGDRLCDDGRILITVPAAQWLWSHHDEAHHHFRRYSRRSLRSVISDAGLRVLGIGNFNTLLFPLAVAQRLAQRISGSEAPADARPAQWMNASLQTVFSSERYLVGRIPLPVGLSLWAVAGR